MLDVLDKGDRLKAEPIPALYILPLLMSEGIHVYFLTTPTEH